MRFFYSDVIIVSSGNSVIISNLIPNITYYFSATYSDLDGNEGDFSNEIFYNKDSILSVK